MSFAGQLADRLTYIPYIIRLNPFPPPTLVCCLARWQPVEYMSLIYQLECPLTDRGEPMTKKDYELIAQAFALYKCLDQPTRWFVAQALADRLEKDNPRFDRARFIEACDLSSSRTGVAA